MLKIQKQNEEYCAIITPSVSAFEEKWQHILEEV